MKALILIPTTGQVIPAGFLERSVPQFDTCSGAAYFAVVAGKQKLVVNHYPAVTTKELQDFMEKHKDDEASLVVLGKHDGTMMPEDQQPFVLFNNPDGSPAIVCAIEGDYDNMKKPDSAHTGEYFAAHLSLKPLIASAFEEHGGDTTKVLEDLNNSIITRAIKGFSSGRGVVALMDHKGMAVTICTDKQVENGYTWGFASQTFDVDGVHRIDPAKPTKFGEEAPVQAPTVPAVPGSSPEFPAPGPFPKPGDTPPQGDTATMDDLVEIAPKSSLGHHINNREKKAFYHGYYPTGELKDITASWKDGTPIKVKRSAVKPQHLWQLTVSQNSVLKPAETPKPADTPKDMKAPDKPQSGFQKMEAAALAAKIPDAREQNNMLALMGSTQFSKLVASVGENIKDPKEWVKAEALNPSFSQHLALNGLEEVLALPDECLEQICKGFPKYGRMLINELRVEIHNLREQLKRAGSAPKTASGDAKKEENLHELVQKKEEQKSTVQPGKNLEQMVPMAL